MIQQAKRFQTTAAHHGTAALTDPRKSAPSSTRMTKARRADGRGVVVEPAEFVAESLTNDERLELRANEEKIESGAWAWLEMGDALAKIQAKRLYRSTHGTFEAYLASRWHLDRSIAYGLIAAVRVNRIASSVMDVTGLRIANESQCRPLAKLDDAGIVEVLKRVGERIGPGSDGVKVPTAKILAQFVREYRGAPDDTKRQRPPEAPASLPAKRPAGDTATKARRVPLSSLQAEAATLTACVAEVFSELVDQAERIAKAKNAAALASSDFDWMAEDVLWTAMRRGLDEMEERSRH